MKKTIGFSCTKEGAKNYARHDSMSQSKSKWGWIPSICAAAMITAIIIFSSRTRKYRYKERSGSPLIQVVQVVAAAIKKRKLEFPSDISLLYEDSSPESRVHPTNQFR